MTTKIFILVNVLAALGLSGAATAEVYKWTDESGNVRYSDRPPADKVDLKTIDLKNKYTNNLPESTQSANVLTPISNIDKGVSKAVFLEHVLIQLSEVAAGEDPVIGSLFRYPKSVIQELNTAYTKREPPNRAFRCEKNGPLKLQNAKYIISKADFEAPFYELFSSNGYQVANERERYFSQQEKVQKDISIAAIITRIEIKYCGYGTATSIDEYAQNATSLQIRWEVFDNLHRKVVYSAVTEGSDDAFNVKPRFKGGIVSASAAFSNALRNLLAQRDFVNLLALEKNNSLSLQKPVSLTNNDVKVIAMSGVRSGKFSDKVAEIKKGVVTIRTSAGHGSGFIVSDAGHILTNAHVIAGSNRILVIIDNKQHAADIISSDPVRDVALLKINDGFRGKALAVEREKVKLGESIYVVGTPIDERLAFSISKGILSGQRTLESLDFYQTDATINPGNSGGPAFNESGNVIAITVARLQTEVGGATNIGYLIPIEAALRALGIKFGA